MENVEGMESVAGMESVEGMKSERDSCFTRGRISIMCYILFELDIERKVLVPNPIFCSSVIRYYLVRMPMFFLILLSDFFVYIFKVSPCTLWL